MLPGPFCTRQLARLGARVVKVELPHWPDPARRIPGLFRWLHKGKRMLRINFREPEGLKKLHAFLSRADVLVEGFRPDLMERLGLGPKALARRFPRLIYCSISGFGSRGRRQAAHDLNVQGWAGILGRPPRMPNLSASDVAAGWEAASRISAALLGRFRTGRRAYLDISMVDCAREAGVCGLQAVLERSPFYVLYKTKDNRWLSVAAVERRYQEELLRRLDRPGLAGLDARRHAVKLRSSLRKTFLTRSQEAWLRLLAGAEACVGPA